MYLFDKCETCDKSKRESKSVYSRIVLSFFLLFSLELWGLRRYEFAFGFAKRKRYDMIALGFP